METISKKVYVAPSVEVVTMENEGVIAASGSLPDVGDGGNAFGYVAPSSHSATSRDIEDMIDDLLTY